MPRTAGHRSSRVTATEPEWELFDLEADPLEMRNVYADPSYQDVVTSLKEELLRHKDSPGDD